MKSLIIFLLITYKKILSPILVFLFGGSCRFTPTCSEYAIDVIKKHGVFKGTILSIGRILRCNPFLGALLDPVS